MMVDFGAALKKGQDDPGPAPEVAAHEPDRVIAPPTPQIVDLAAVKSQLAVYNQTVDRLLTEAKALVVKDDASRAVGINLGSLAKKTNRELEDLRVGYKKPALEYGRMIDNIFGAIQQSLKEIETTCKAADKVYQAKLDLEARKAAEAARKAAEDLQEKINKEAAEAGVEAPLVQAPAVAPPPKGVKTESGSISYRTDWKAEIVDPAQVPDKYRVIDMTLINRDVKAGVREIPGVRIFEDKTPLYR